MTNLQQNKDMIDDRRQQAEEDQERHLGKQISTATLVDLLCDRDLTREQSQDLLEHIGSQI